MPTVTAEAGKLEDPFAGRDVKRATLALFLILFVSYCSFLSGAPSHHNTVTRIALTINLVQHGRIDIEGFDHLTGDKAQHKGKYYSDKAPGMSFLAAPIAYLFTRFLPIEPIAGDDDPMWYRLQVLIWLCVIATSGLLTALAGTALFSFMLERTGSLAAALISAFTYGLATPTWGWATSLYSHAAVGALLILGFIAADRSVRGADARLSYGGAAQPALCGLLLGTAIVTEFTAAVPAAVIGGYLIASIVCTKDPKAAVRCVLSAGAGGAVPLILLLLYNFAAFDSPFAVGYSNVVGFDGMRTGYFGINLPDLHVLFEILLGEHRGLLWLSPIAFVAAYATIANLVHDRDRVLNAVVLAIALYYLLVNAGYYYWDGGDSTGPRHITPIYPFLAAALGIWLVSATDRVGALVLLVLLCSATISLACVAVTMTSPERVLNPLTQLIGPRFLSGVWRQAIVYKFTGVPGWQQFPLLVGTWLGLGAIFWCAWARGAPPGARR
jgi:hypothetical protein